MVFEDCGDAFLEAGFETFSDSQIMTIAFASTMNAFMWNLMYFPQMSSASASEADESIIIDFVVMHLRRANVTFGGLCKSTLYYDSGNR